MKSSKSILTALVCHLCLNIGQVLGSDINNEVICPDKNPVNCYPRLFKPEKEWKVVLEGQMIPPGLDIRLNLENMNREAKIADEKPRHKPNHELVVSNSDPGFRSLIDFIYGFSNGMYSKTSFDIIETHFNELIDWASDRELGIEIGENVQPLLKLTGLFKEEEDNYMFNLSTEEYEIIQEKTYRILSSSFQNNLEAQERFLQFLKDPQVLLKLLATPKSSDSLLITKRKLGLLGSLVNNGLFNKYFELGGLEYNLIDLYSDCKNNAVRERIMIILDSCKHHDKREAEKDTIHHDNDDGVDLRFSKYVQTKLMESTSNDHETMHILKKFAKVKLESEKKGAVKVSTEFLDWMDSQINRAKNAAMLLKRGEDRGEDDGGVIDYGGNKNNLNEKKTNNNNNNNGNYGDVRDKTNYNNIDTDALDLEDLVEFRHQVFGNRLGTRRDAMDEL